MAGSKEIRNKIKSVQSTRKITKAMEMVCGLQDEEGAGPHARVAALRRARAADRDARRQGQSPSTSIRSSLKRADGQARRR